jgi:hypothetical protein
VTGIDAVLREMRASAARIPKRHRPPRPRVPTRPPARSGTRPLIRGHEPSFDPREGLTATAAQWSDGARTPSQDYWTRTFEVAHAHRYGADAVGKDVRLYSTHLRGTPVLRGCLAPATTIDQTSTEFVMETQRSLPLDHGYISILRSAVAALLEESRKSDPRAQSITVTAIAVLGLTSTRLVVRDDDGNNLFESEG